MSSTHPVDPAGGSTRQRTNHEARTPSPQPAGMGARVREGDSLRKGMAFLRRYLWWLGGGAVAGIGLAVVYLIVQPPLYEADAVVLIAEPEARSPVGETEIGSLLQASYGLGISSTIEDELHRLRSRSFSRDLALKMADRRRMRDGGYFPLLWREFPYDSTLVGLDTVSTRILENLRVNRLDQRSNAIRITYTGRSPAEVVEVVELALLTYDEASTRTSRQQARGALDFLKGELERVEQSLNVSEENIRRFMNDNELVQLDAQAEDLVRSISKLEADRYLLTTRRASIRETIEIYRKEVELLTPGLSEQLTAALSPRIDQLQFMLAEKQTQRTLLVSRNPDLVRMPDNPTLMELDRQIEGLNAEIESLSSRLVDSEYGFISSTEEKVTDRYIELRNQILTLEIEGQQVDTQLENLTVEIDRLRMQFDLLPDEMIELARYERQLQMDESIYLLIARQAAETALWEQTQGSLARVLDAPLRPNRSVSPKKGVSLLAGGLMGFLLCLGGVLVWSRTRLTITNLDDLTDRELPLLAVIPDNTPLISATYRGADRVQTEHGYVSTSLLAFLDPISHAAESYRRLQSNLLYSRPDQPLRMLMVTSAGKGEGKTTVSGNLAVSLAEAGRSVLLLDADHRRPRVHRLFGTQQEPGVTDVLFKGASIEEAIRATPVENVHVLGAGRAIPNPAEISRSNAYMKLLDGVQERYDFVIIDTSPLGIISDATPLLHRVDGVVAIARFGVSKLPELDQLLGLFRQYNANVIGAVVTAFDPRKAGSSDTYSPSYAYYSNARYYQDYEAEVPN